MTSYTRADCAANVLGAIPVITGILFQRAGQGQAFCDFQLFPSVAVALAGAPYNFVVTTLSTGVYRISWL
jgi:hypothetical protein